MDQATKLRNLIKNSQAATKKARVIAVTSGKGGVGKSNVAINLAVELKKRDLKVIILDADFGLANIEVMFGAVPKHNLSDVIYHGKSIKEVITWGPMDIGFISGGCGIAQLSQLTMEQIYVLVNSLCELDEMADVVIVDTGAGISGSVMEFLVASGEVLLVTTPEPTSITDSYSLLKALGNHPKFNADTTTVKMIANKVNDTVEGHNLYKKLNSVVESYLRIKLGFLGVVPMDNSLSKAVMQQSPVCIQNPNSKAGKAFAGIVSVLMNLEDNQKTVKRGMTGFFASFFSKGKS